jgi:DNA mismatch repair protein MutL
VVKSTAMPDIIQLLPETVANQIAAGEVIQRPASAVKELLENSVDAGSRKIELFIKDSGKTLIQIIDNGSGMTDTDVRLAFERHATSKIRTANDLFSIRTMGFRGEALASIAAISQVEVKTRCHDNEVGTMIEIEANEIKRQEPAGTVPGTSISIKNLFYNVPARRNFLKSNTIEARHIIDEFERIAYAHHEINLSLVQNGIEIFRLPPSNFRQRIVNINGNPYNERLVPVTETTSYISINGFIGKPEFSRKTRGEQFFFVNKRFIKDNYLHHAVSSAFEELLPKDSYASYWLFIDIDPSRIDVNIHPTKTEIKFEDERSIYAVVRAAVKRALGQYHVMPALDFDRESGFDVPHSMRYQPVQQPGITVNTGFNPFETQSRIAPAFGQTPNQIQHFYTKPEITGILPVDFPPPPDEPFFQFGNFIITKSQDNLVLIDANAAHQLILFQKFHHQLLNHQPTTQQSLFPQTLNLSSSDYSLLKEIHNDLTMLGFDLQEFGLNTFAIHGVPSDIEKGKEREILESILEQYKNHKGAQTIGSSENVARSMARAIAIRKNTSLKDHEIKMIVNSLHKLPPGERFIDGKPCITMLKTTDLSGYFR